MVKGWFRKAVYEMKEELKAIKVSVPLSLPGFEIPVIVCSQLAEEGHQNSSILFSQSVTSRKWVCSERQQVLYIGALREVQNSRTPTSYNEGAILMCIWNSETSPTQSMHWNVWNRSWSGIIALALSVLHYTICIPLNIEFSWVTKNI